MVKLRLVKRRPAISLDKDNEKKGKKEIDLDLLVSEKENEQIVLDNDNIEEFKIILQDSNLRIYNDGRLFDIKRNKFWKPLIHENSGKHRTTPSFSNKMGCVFYDKLVALHFVKNDDLINKKFILHKNGDIRDDHYINLEWCTIAKYHEAESELLFEEFIKRQNPKFEYRPFPQNDKYICFTDGKIYTKYYNKLMSLQRSEDDYEGVHLRINDENIYFFVHQVIALTFLVNPRPDLYDRIDHINHIRFDNRVENLRWADVDLNNANRNLENLHRIKIHQYDYETDKLIATYNSRIEAAQGSGLSKSSITDCLKGRKECILFKNNQKYYYFEYDDPEYAQTYPKPENSVKIIDHSSHWLCSDGRIWSESRTRFMKPQIVKGYVHITLINDKDEKTHSSLHRLVAIHFTDPLPENYETLEVNHIDGNKTNNHIDNLEFLISVDNIRHSIDILGQHVKKVSCYNTETKETIIFPSRKKAGEYFDLAGSHHIGEYINKCESDWLYRGKYILKNMTNDSEIVSEDELSDEEYIFSDED